jgi:hypothetical protein
VFIGDDQFTFFKYIQKYYHSLQLYDISRLSDLKTEAQQMIYNIQVDDKETMSFEKFEGIVDYSLFNDNELRIFVPQDMIKPDRIDDGDIRIAD